MAIQQTRSAFGLTSIATRSVLNSIARLTIRLQMHSGTLFWVCILFGIRSTISYSNDADESIVLPKFGDRISPRTRFIEVEKLRSTTTTNNNNNNNLNDNDNSGSSNSNSNNSSKYSADISAVSNPNYSANNYSNNSNKTEVTEYGFNLNGSDENHNDHDHDDDNATGVSVVHGAIAAVPNGGSDSVSISYNSTNGSKQNRPYHASHAQMSTGKKSDAFHGGDRVQFDVIDSDNNDIFNALLRQHKSLNIAAANDGNGAYNSELTHAEQILCNNKSKQCPNGGVGADNEINDEIDLRNGNSKSSAQAHRLEMSTEFFVVPSTSPSSTNPLLHHLPGGTYCPK